MTIPVNILIVEDDANISLALKIILHRALVRAEITMVRDGQAALGQLHGGGFDLVISDWNMPRVSGLELLTAIRSNTSTQRLPFLMLTARSDVGSYGDMLNNEFSDYISKPFDNDVFVEKVLTLLEVAHDNH
jgi:two-component system chemotaxis response regulator CheY